MGRGRRRTLNHRPRLAAVAAVALGAGVTWNISNVNPVADSLGPRYGVSLATVGLFTTALFTTHLLAQLPSGRAADRFGPRRIGLVAVGFVVVGNLVCLIAADPALAILGRALVGIGSGSGFVAGADYMRSANPSPFLQGIYGGSTMAGGGLAIDVVPQLESWLGWRAAYWTALAIALAVGLVLRLAPADTKRSSRRQRGFVTDRRLLPLAVIHAATFGLSVVAADWAYELLTHHGHGRRISALIGALFLLAGMVTRPLGGYLVRQRPDLARGAVAASLTAGSLATLLLALPLPLVVLGSAALTAGLAAGLPLATVFSRAQATVPEAPAAAVGLVNAGAVLTIVVGIPLAGLSFSLPGDGRIGFAVIGGLVGAGLLALRSAAL
jgi:MFS family permease